MNSDHLPVFSVVLPTYNRAVLLCRAIASVVNQSFTDWELIVVDDGSSDSTPEVVGAFADNRIHYIRLDHSGGVSAARNTGIRAARGRYISFLDDDDEYMPKFLEKMYAAMESSADEVGFAWCGIKRVAMTRSGLQVDRTLDWPNAADDNSKDHSNGHDYLQVATSYGLTVKSACFDVVGLFDEDLQAAVDTDLLFRLGAEYSYKVLPEILVTLYVHPGEQLTDRNARRALAMERVIGNNLREISKSDLLWIRYHRSAAELFYSIGNRRRGRYWMMRAFARQPMYWQTWKSWLFFELIGHENLGLRAKMSL